METGIARMSSQPTSVVRASALNIVGSRITRNPTLCRLGRTWFLLNRCYRRPYFGKDFGAQPPWYEPLN